MNREIQPMVNQIEIHPFFQQGTALRVMEAYGVVPQAWGPFSEAQKDIFHHRALAKIAGMDIGHSEILDHHSFCAARQINSVKIHG